MDHNSSISKVSDGKPGGFTALQHELPLWWHGLPAVVRSPVWPGILAALTILGMLLAFHQVVSGIVQQSEVRHKAIAMQAEATLRCNILRDLRASDSCLTQLNAAAHGDTAHGLRQSGKISHAIDVAQAGREDAADNEAESSPGEPYERSPQTGQF